MKRTIIICLSVVFVCIARSEENTAKSKSLAIFDFVDSYGYVSNETEKVTLLIFAEIASSDSEIKMLERSEMQKIMKEQELSASGLSSKNGSIKLGKLLGAEYILNGKIYYLQGKICFNGKLVNCKTGKVNGISKSFAKQKNKDDMYLAFSKVIAKYIVKKLNPPPPDKKK